MNFDEAMETVRAGSVFTTHTPVAAGHDAFAFELVEKFFWQYWGQIGIDRNRFMELASHDQGWGSQFSMTVLAFRLSAYHNGVSQATRSRFTEDVGRTLARHARGTGPHRPHHQRRPHGNLACAGATHALQPISTSRLDGRGGRPTNLARRRRHPRCRTVEGACGAQVQAHRLCARPCATAISAPRRRLQTHGSGGWAARSQRLDPGLCPPLCHLQTRHADLPRHGAA